MKNKLTRDPQPGKNATREELAEFWDTHSFADYMDEFKPVEVRFAKNLSQGITIRLDEKTLSKVREKAEKKGIGPTTLIRMWIREQISAA